MSVTITPRQMESFVRKASKKVMDRAVQSQRVAGGLAHGRVVQRVTDAKPRPPVDTGRYKFSWKFGNVPGGSMVWSEDPKAGVMEYGARPGRIPLPLAGRRGPVPFKALVEWAKRKFYSSKGWQKRVNERATTQQAAARARRAAFRAQAEALEDEQGFMGMAEAWGAAHEESNRSLSIARQAAFGDARRARGTRDESARYNRALAKMAPGLVRQRRAQITSGRRDSFAWAIAVAVQRREHMFGLKGHHIITDPAFVREMRALSLRLFMESVRQGGA